VIEPPPPRNLGPDFPVQRIENNYREVLPTVQVDKCFVTHSGIGLKRLRVVPESVFQNAHAARFNRYFHRYALYKYFSERRVRSPEPRLLMLHHHWAAGYHHWITECLLKTQFVDPAQYVVVVPQDYPAFAKETLAMYPFAGTLELPPGQGLVARSLTLVANPHSGHFNPAHLRALKASLSERCGGDGPRADHVYVTRRGEQLRQVENEDAVIDALADFDFLIVDPGSLTFREQFHLFSHCSVLVSVHGAGITNCMFMPEGGRVLELYRAVAPERDGMNACYWRLSTASGLDYYVQFCAHGENRGGDIDRTNIRVDIDELKRNVEAMLTAGG
jgi:capsular polysaccharide biosynthesis protein